MHKVAVGPLGPGDERDGCALITWLSRSGQTSRSGLERVLASLDRVGHRAGYTDGECDGAGVMVDLPRALWADLLAEVGHPPSLAYDPQFEVAHLLAPPEQQERAARDLRAAARGLGLTPLLLRRAPTDPDALGPRGRAEAPVMLQLAMRGQACAGASRLAALSSLEAAGWHVASWSASTAVYKARADGRALGRYYGDLRDRRLTTAFVLGHLRFSTNTHSRFSRVQPFPSLGHNGEINTLARLRDVARDLDVPLPEGGSDSQDLCRLIRGLGERSGLSLLETVLLLFPPVPGELAREPERVRHLLETARDRIGPVAQGPAAVVARLGDEVVASLDALGLRPLWLVTTADAYYLTSERTVVPFAELSAEPKPLAPGEKLAFLLSAGQPPRPLDEAAFRAEALSRLAGRLPAAPSGADAPPPPVLGWPLAERPDARPALFGWDHEDVEICRLMADEGRDPIGSLGYDGPLAALAEERRQVADFLHETVAVVTNPAIDREREGEHFSTDVLAGVRPPLPGEGRPAGPFLRLAAPLVVEVMPEVPDLATAAAAADVARRAGVPAWTDLTLPSAVLDLSFDPDEEGLAAALDRLAAEACRAVAAGAALLVLDDGRALSGGRAPIDPLLGLGRVDRALRDTPAGSLRRRTSVLVRSGSIRRLHDLMACLGLGADLVSPYLLVREAARSDDPASAAQRLLATLREGVEKVCSTLGVHELAGYSRAFSSVGLSAEVAALFGIPAYLAEGSGHDLRRFEQEARQRLAEAEALDRTPGRISPARVYHLYPKIWKAAGEAAAGRAPYAAYASRLAELEAARPISLRHLLDLDLTADGARVAAADASIGEHRYPLVISSMSFGSQGEVAYRAYLEGAVRAGILCLNGEGGEMPDLVGRHPRHRGVQVASGRFGIAAPLIAHTRYLEIKIGQGAKPGEGGHLPARKVSHKVALARHAQPGVDLISPSNNHDLYSIEDLAQLIDELKTVSPEARVIVKLPAVAGIGTIAVGVVKAGADVVTLSGFDGGTGAARRHASRHVGLPAEIGLFETHRALIEAGLRDHAEVWCDGGLKSGRDVVKMMLLGADRAAFGSLAMVAAGCTICRACQTDTCHVGIATQIETSEEAAAKGLKRFLPRQRDEAAAAVCRLFTAIGEEVADLTAHLGYARSRDLVGRAEHLVQRRGLDRLDLRPLLVSLPAPGSRRRSGLAPEDPSGRAAPWEGRGGHGQRMLGTALSGQLVRRHRTRGLSPAPADAAHTRRVEGATVGQGLAVFHTAHLDTVVLGGAQDGVAKGAAGGRVAVLKARCADGTFRDGAVGKSFAYGAVGGRLFVQGVADSRAAVRLSGGSVVFGAMPDGPLDGTARTAQLKGFAFEYMTGGTVVCLGDPGPWMAAGMTGGVVYVALWPHWGLDLEAVRRRLARGATCRIEATLAAADVRSIGRLLGEYADLLAQSGQAEAADRVRRLGGAPQGAFARVVPASSQVAPEVSTE
jgi:glutamate synthase (NADPH/NADH) large chain